MKEKILHKNKHKKIQSRIIGITLSCLLTMCLLISGICFFIFNGYLKDSLVKSSKASLDILADSIDSNITSITQLIRFCQSSSSIAEYIKDNPNPGAVLSVATVERLTEEYNSNLTNAYIPRLAIITENHFIQVVTTAYSSSKNLAEEAPLLEYYDKALSSKSYDFSMGLVKDPFYSHGPTVLPIIRPITYQYNGIRGGTLFMEVNQTLFTDAFKKYSITEDSHLFLTVCDHIYMYSDNNLVEIPELPKDVVSSSLSFKGITISQSISSSELRDDYRLLFFVLIGIMLMIVLIGIVEMFILNRMISNPILKLRAKMEKVSGGDFKRDSNIEWDTELGDIGRGINDLSENVEALMETRLENEKQKRDLEYQVLLSQINPHFLYNTLNSIKWMATMQGAEGISEMTTALAKLLKSVSKGTGNVVSIEEELSLLKDYFTIQSYRYGGTITLDISVEDPKLLKCGIVKFTLQPIVENAIFHGIEPKGHGSIEVNVGYEKSGILITVSDDGVGMSEEKIKDLFEKESAQTSDFFKELGVKNVNKRLSYEFGEEFGLTAESREGEYTVMYIHIPLREL